MQLTAKPLTPRECMEGLHTVYGGWAKTDAFESRMRYREMNRRLWVEALGFVCGLGKVLLVLYTICVSRAYPMSLGLLR